MTGLPGPLPVVRAKQAIDELPERGGTIQIIVDSRAACANLQRMAEGMGYGFEQDMQEKGRYLVSIMVRQRGSLSGQHQARQTEANPTGTIIVLGHDTLGQGDDGLGHTLIKQYLLTISQLDKTPKVVLLLNSGVRLAVKGTDTVEDLRTLTLRGCLVLVCETSARHYGLKDQIGTGTLSNMVTIATWLSKGYSTVTL